MQKGNVAVILTIGLLVIGTVALALTVNSASAVTKPVKPKTCICPPPVNDPGNNNATRIGSGTTSGSSGGSGTIQR